MLKKNYFLLMFDDRFNIIFYKFRNIPNIILLNMNQILVILGILLISVHSQNCKTPTAGFVLKQIIVNSVTSRGADISGNGNYLLGTVGIVSSTRKSTLNKFNAGTFTSITPTPVPVTLDGNLNFGSFSNDGSILSITENSNIKIYRPTLISSLTSSNYIQQIPAPVGGELNIYAEVSQDGTLLAVSTGSTVSFGGSIYKWNSVSNMFDNPISLTGIQGKYGLTISPNNQYILAYDFNDVPGTLKKFKIYKKDTASSNPNTFLNTPIQVIMTPYQRIRGDITNNIAVVTSFNGTFRIYRNTDGAVLQNLDSISTVSIIQSVKISNDERFIFIGQASKGMSIFQKNPTSNLYQKIQQKQNTFALYDIDITVTNSYLVGAYGPDNIRIYINCFKDYATSCSDPLQANTCLPTFTANLGNCECQAPLILKKDETNCPTDIGLGVLTIAGCCTSEQSWSRTIGSGSCISCPSSLNCQKCNQPNLCEICKTNFVLDGTHCCQSPCKTCLAATPNVCTDCVAGYVLDGTHCCQSPCKTCLAATPNVCTDCVAGYVLDGTHCCQSPCKTCLAATPNVCNDCVENYILDQNYCCHLFCATCMQITPTICTTCVDPPNYVLDEDHCCRNPCKTCLGVTPTECITCLETFVLDGVHCCQSPCKTCSAATPNVCTDCVAGFVLDGTYCCQSPCKTCLIMTPKTCLSCLQGFFLDKVQCTTCVEDGKYVSGQLCLECSKQCKTCKKKANYCLKCAKGYFKYQHRCIQCNNQLKKGKFKIIQHNNC